MQFRCFMCTQKGACPTIVKDILIRIYIYILIVLLSPPNLLPNIIIIILDSDEKR